MRLEAKLFINIPAAQVIGMFENATRLGVRDTIVLMHNDAVKDSPVLTGNNRRSLAAEVSGMGEVANGGEAPPERVVDDRKLEGALYSTSGYGGTLETGSSRMVARPYMKPALDRHMPRLAEKIKRHLPQ